MLAVSLSGSAIPFGNSTSNPRDPRFVGIGSTKSSLVVREVGLFLHPLLGTWTHIFFLLRSYTPLIFNVNDTFSITAPNFFSVASDGHFICAFRKLLWLSMRLAFSRWCDMASGCRMVVAPLPHCFYHEAGALVECFVMQDSRHSISPKTVTLAEDRGVQRTQCSQLATK